MNAGQHIRYLKRQEIDTGRWDDCIRSASNGLIYAFHFYLDHMADGQWDALVWGDYEAVMPLPWRRKAGIRYLYQPAFTQQTGIFSGHPITPLLTDSFLQQLTKHFRFAEIYLNHACCHPTLQSHANFILSLDTTYEKLSGQYKTTLTRSLKLADRNSLLYVTGFDLRAALNNYQREYATRLPEIRTEDYRHFEAVCLFLQQRGQLLVAAAIDQHRETLATAVLLRDQHRLYLLQPTTLPAGRKAGANHFLLDQLIREYAGTPLILDFEGSDQPGIAQFYKNFGSLDQPYFFYRYNRLPWPLKLLK